MEKMIKDLILYVDKKVANEDDKEHFCNFIHHLKSSKKVSFIFRGEDNLNDSYKTSVDNISKLSQELFILGEKGRTFFEEKHYDNIFQFLWEKYSTKVCKLKFNNHSTLEVVSAFLKNNDEIMAYFSDSTNHDNFIKLSELPNDEKNAIADYYVAILHTIGKSGISKSYFLSTTKKKTIAERFTNNKDGIILYGWVPRKGKNKKIIKYLDLEKKSKCVKSRNLPICNTVLYPDQEEICIKCGLLPHFIIGFQHQNKFYINPATLNLWNDDIVYNGMDINQIGFDKILSSSGYSSSFIFVDGTYYRISKDEVINI